MKVNGDLNVGGDLECDSAEGNNIEAEVTTSKTLTCDSIKTETIFADEIHLDDLKSDTSKIIIEGDVLFVDTPKKSTKETSFLQWAEIETSSISNAFQGWSRAETSTCGGAQILGGHCHFAEEEITKTYALPRHSWLRVTANFHMLDNWKGETGYLLLDGQLVWSQHGTSETTTGDICGGSGADRVNIPIHITRPHSAQNVTLTFGSTLESDPCHASFAIDDVVVYTRTS